MSNNSFDLIPAIDILDGKCVRLTQGKYNEVEEFSTDPEEVAKKWVGCGADRLHLIDLNGAKEGEPVNFKVISRIVRAVGVKVQVGGGVRSHKVIKDYLNEGVSYLILGTRAFKDRNFLEEVKKLYSENIIIGLDLKNNKVAVSGWQETSEIEINQIPEYIEGIKQVIHTDITKDGTLAGPNLSSVKEIAGVLQSNIIVSGGLSSIDDIVEILNVKKQKYSNISGVILGKSLYKGTIDLSSAIELVRKEMTSKNP